MTRFALLVLVLTTISAVEAQDAAQPDKAAGEKSEADAQAAERLRAEEIARWEAEIQRIAADKVAAGKTNDRERMKQLIQSDKHAKRQLLICKNKPADQLLREVEQKRQIEAQEKERERQRALWDSFPKPGAQAKAVPMPPPAGVNVIEVVYAAQSAVKTRLKNPAGAKFPGIFSGVDLREHCRYRSDGTYTVTSYVDATNSFGGQLRVLYTATVTPSGKDWVVSDVKLHE